MKDRLTQILSAFERLSPQEQKTVLILALSVTLAVVGFSAYFVKRDLRRTAQRIAAKEDKLREISSIRTDYKRHLDAQNRLAAEVRRNNKTRILSYLEGLSQAANIDLKNASERSGENTGSSLVKEEAAQVEIKNVSLDRLHEFLRRIEEGNRLVKIRRLKIRTRFDNKEMLDASVVVGTFKPTESS